MRARHVAVIAALAGAASIAGTSATARQPARPAAVSCGVERWAVKTLSDSDAERVDFQPRHTTVTTLRRLHPPDRLPKTRIAPVELRTYRLTALLVEAKREKDRDIHLVIADPAHRKRTMIVELPDVACKGPAGSAKRAQMKSARRHFEDACGVPSRSHFKRLRGTATITGVGFFDDLHHQRGVAPNGIELHPLLSFVSSSCRPA